uniref:Secreted protein n=1 Tax=Globodera pallida TaxID=36090 RepID=A0A183CBS2_GLOPA
MGHRRCCTACTCGAGVCMVNNNDEFCPKSSASRCGAAQSNSSNGRQDQPQQQINALRAQMDQLQYELGQLRQYAPAGADWMEPVWPFSNNVDYHPKSMLVRRHMAWQPMRRGIENDV